eukprot:CAMPEP_0177765862 /NCGR_PEP_ID=MMETSP0491_2-20121128/8212_1 /TAXON_ID=63592 /ORGANISM="Tetraselmis chuii, Strain PLY429" /LENGTH=493 /DNA_ID=CAMNT_0019282227 /DNA_START=157 /DNA_END=1638 /DNA_ORIENTATION=+
MQTPAGRTKSERQPPNAQRRGENITRRVGRDLGGISGTQGSSSSKAILPAQRVPVVDEDNQAGLSSDAATTGNRHTILVKPAPKISNFIVSGVRMYNVLGRRAGSQAMMLRRTLRYSISGKKTAPGRTAGGGEPSTESSRRISVNINSLVFGGNNKPSSSPRTTRKRDVSLIVAATYHPQEEYGDDVNVHCICAASMVHVSMEKLGDEPHTAVLDVPPEAANKKLRLLCLIWEEHADLSMMSRKQGKPLSTGVRKLSEGVHHIFGFVPNRSRCRWSLTPFPKGDKECVTQLHKGCIYLDALASDEDLRTKHARICLSRASQNDLSWPLDSLGSVRARFAFTWMKGGVEAAAGGSLLGTSAAAVVAQSSSTIFHFMPTEGNVASFTEITRNWECPMCGLRCTHFAALGMHLQASHDMFRYVFNGTGDDCMPEVCVRGCTNDAPSTHFTNSLRHPNSGHSLFHETASKEFLYSKSARRAERQMSQRRRSAAAAPP